MVWFMPLKVALSSRATLSRRAASLSVALILPGKALISPTPKGGVVGVRGLPGARIRPRVETIPYGTPRLLNTAFRRILQALAFWIRGTAEPNARLDTAYSLRLLPTEERLLIRLSCSTFYFCHLNEKKEALQRFLFPCFVSLLLPYAIVFLKTTLKGAITIYHIFG